MAIEFGLTDAGLVVPRLSDYLTEIQSRYEEQVGFSVDWDNDLVIGILAAIMAQLLDEQAEAIIAVYGAMDPNAATGVQLSNLARISGVNREKATSSTVPFGVTFAGSPGTVIVAGSLVAGGGLDGNARWATLTDQTISAGGFAFNVPLEAVEPGATSALVGEINTIVTPIPGWDTVTNGNAATVGREDETDDQLRFRRVQSIAASGGIGIASIRAKLLALEFITAAIVIDNTDNSPRTVLGVPMPATSYLAVVLPSGLSSEDADTVLTTLYNNTPVAIQPAGTDVVGSVIGLDGVAKPVSFDYATEVQADVSVVLVLAIGVAIEDASASLQALVESHVQNLGLGEPLRHLALCGFAAQVAGVISLTSLINGSAADLEPTVIQKLIVGTWSATT